MTIRRRTGRSSLDSSIGEPVSRGFPRVTDWHQEQTDLSVSLVLSCMYKRSRCSRASDAQRHQPGSSSMGAIARTSFFVLYSVFKERRVEFGRVVQGSTMLPTFWGATEVVPTGRICRLLHLQPWSRRAGACGLKRSANLPGTSRGVKPRSEPCERHRGACPRLSGGPTT